MRRNMVIDVCKKLLEKVGAAMHVAHRVNANAARNAGLWPVDEAGAGFSY